MATHSDGYLLNARLRGPDAIPTNQMVDALSSLAFDMRQAALGNSVLIVQWVEWVRKSKVNADALVRVLMLILAVQGMSTDDVALLARDLRETSTQRRRPPRLIRQTGTRESPKLW